MGGPLPTQQLTDQSIVPRLDPMFIFRSIPCLFFRMSNRTNLDVELMLFILQISLALAFWANFTQSVSQRVIQRLGQRQQQALVVVIEWMPTHYVWCYTINHNILNWNSWSFPHTSHYYSTLVVAAWKLNNSSPTSTLYLH